MTLTQQHHYHLLFRSHHQELLVFAGQHSNHDIAEDLVQEAYARFLQQAQTGTIDNPRAYLYTITRNLSADYLRQGQVRTKHHDDSDVDLETIADPHQEPDRIVDAQLRLQRCLEALDNLPEVYRHVFLLHRIDGLTYAEIGQALNLHTRKAERYATKALAHCYAYANNDPQK
jgi:RNA polymerase sigma-70 factor (ECF subfamily)